MKVTVKQNPRVVVTAKPPWIGREKFEIQLETCENIAKEIKRHVDDVESCEVEYDTEIQCSHCGNEWDTTLSDETDCQACCNAEVAEYEARTGKTYS